MNLNRATIEHLRDEAYAVLCREAAEEGLHSLERQRTEIIDVGLPFGSATGNDSRATSNGSWRAARDSEAALRSRLHQIARIEQHLQGVLRQELHSYLAAASEEYAGFATAQEHLDRWEALFHRLPDKLSALADDVRRVLDDSPGAQGIRDLNLFTSLRDSAMGVKAHLDQLDDAGRLFAAIVASPEFYLPALPGFRLVDWVNRIFLLHPHELAAETARVETELRQFVACHHEAILARLRASGAACQRAAGEFLESYWNQLRVHAQIHYVEEREIGEVIDELLQRYAAAAPNCTGFSGTTGRLVAQPRRSPAA